MQFSASELFDISKESEAPRKLYGNSEFANGCLIAPSYFDGPEK